MIPSLIISKLISEKKNLKEKLEKEINNFNVIPLPPFLKKPDIKIEQYHKNRETKLDIEELINEEIVGNFFIKFDENKNCIIVLYNLNFSLKELKEVDKYLNISEFSIFSISYKRLKILEKIFVDLVRNEMSKYQLKESNPLLNKRIEKNVYSVINNDSSENKTICKTIEDIIYQLNILSTKEKAPKGLTVYFYDKTSREQKHEYFEVYFGIIEKFLIDKENADILSKSCISDEVKSDINNFFHKNYLKPGITEAQENLKTLLSNSTIKNLAELLYTYI